MKKSARWSLLHQFLFFTLGILGLVLLMQLFLLYTIKQQETTTAQSYLASILSATEHTISENTLNIERSGFALSYNSDLMKIYAQQLDQQTSISSVLEVIKLIYYDNQGEVLDVSLIGLDGAQRSLLMGISSEMNDSLMSLYDFRAADKTDRQFLFFGPNSPYRNSYYVYVAPLFNLVNAQGSKADKLATIVFIGELTGLKRALNVVEPTDAILWIADSDGEIILSNQAGLDKQTSSNLWTHAKIVAQQPLSDTGLTIAGVLVNSAATSNQPIVRYIFLTMAIFVITLLLTLLFFRVRIALPMQRLQAAIEAVGQQGLGQRLPSYNSEEINHIASWINSMLARLELTTEQNRVAQQKLFESEILKQHAELYSLRSQINPHFLYNTLQCMRGIAIENSVPDLADMATALFEIFRYSIKGSERTTIQDELYIARQYLHIFEFRYQGHFAYTLDAADEVMDLTILKMTLQPLIENSIQHGFAHHPGDMRIDIRLFQEAERVCICIQDNGEGIPAEKLTQLRSLLAQPSTTPTTINSSSPVGLDNINRRLRLSFGEGYCLQIENLHPGTQVLITLPAIPFEEESIEGELIRTLVPGRLHLHR